MFLAAHWLDVDRPDRALEELARAGSDALDDPEAHAIRAAALLGLHRDADASEAARAGLSIDPDNLRLLQLLATARWKVGDHSGAEEALLAALRQDPEHPVLLSRYALLVAEEGQLVKADELLVRAARVDPEGAAVQYVGAILAYLRADDSDAAKRGKALLAADPEHVAAHSFLGRLAAERGRTVAAGTHLRRAASLDPASPAHREAGREARVITHPALLPNRLVARFGPGKIWIGAIIVIFGLRGLGLESASVVAAVAYLLFAVYTWTAPPLIRWLLRRQV
jgi:tetratricopeptide (TPR) repeat protein